MAATATSDVPVHEERGARSDIQALRALAVSMVVVYHLWPERFTGGLLGVDVFFVVSGYLIGSGLIAAAMNNRLSLGDFWARRARRLLPASLVVTLVTVIAVIVVVPQRLWHTFMLEALAAIGFAQNLWLAHQSVNYVGAEAEPSPFQHYWSLGVEEQFYLVWPLVLAATWWSARRMRIDVRRSALAVALVGTGGSLAFALSAGSSGSPALFFDPRARAWELGAGLLLAIAVAGKTAGRENVKRIGATAAALAGWTTVLVAGFALDPTTHHPGLITLVPVVGTLLLLGAGRFQLPTVLTRVVELRAIRWLGDASYSVYLWHWPLIVLVPYAVDVRGFERVLLVIGGTLLLAWASLRWIENPFRFGMPRLRANPKAVLLVAAPAMALVAVIPFGSYVFVQVDSERQLAVTANLIEQVTSGDPSNAPSALDVPCFGAPAVEWPSECSPVEVNEPVPSLSTAALDYGPLANVKGCHVEDWYDGTFSPCTYVGGDGNGATVAVFGDSHTQQYLPMVGALADSGNWTVVYATKGHCPWSKALVNQGDQAAESACASWNLEVDAWLKDARPDLIVTSQMRGEPYLLYNGDATGVAGLVDSWEQATSLGAKILVIEDNPASVSDPISCLEQALNYIDCATRREDMGYDPQVEAVKRIVATSVQLVSFTDIYCDVDVCLPVIGNVNVYRNDDHVTGTWTATLTPLLRDRLPGDFLPGS